MPKQSVKAEINTFVQGLITEASPLNFPANASFDEENFVLNRDGTRNRRLGIDYEDSYSFFSQQTLVDYQTNPASAFVWNNVNGNSFINFLVVQLNNTLIFINNESGSLSSNPVAGTLTISEYPSDKKFSFTITNGYLIIVAGTDVIVSVSYDGTSFTKRAVPLLTRDVWGVETKVIPQYETDKSFRSGSNDPYHWYNLENQSWGIPRRYFNSDSYGAPLEAPYLLYRAYTGLWPSNSEVVWTGLQYKPVSSGEQPSERVYPKIYEEVFGGDTKAPKGYFIIDALKRGTSRSAARANNIVKHPQLTGFPIPSFPADTTNGGPTVISEFSGRTFYAGFIGEITQGDARSPNLANHVFFSQLVKNITDVNKCYQEGDPTSRENNEVVDTDGGFIVLAGCDKIIGMKSMLGSLIVIATNGVWAITGGSDYGFSATNYKVDKISSFGGLGPYSIVEEKSRLFYWADAGIYLVSKNQFGDFEVSSITDSTILSFYQAIPSTSKENSVGIYDSSSKKITWDYSIGEGFTSDRESHQLIFDLVLNAFYKNRIFNSVLNNTVIVASFESIPFNFLNDMNQVYHLSDQVFDLTDSIYIQDTVSESGLQAVKYLVGFLDGSNVKYTFAFFRNGDFKDWNSATGGGSDAKAFLLTGDQIVSDSSIAKQIPYLTMHFNRTETIVDVELNPLNQSSCLMRCQWEWANNADSRKWSALRQSYRYAKPPKIVNPGDSYDTGFKVLTTKNKVRGSGRSFALYLETEPEKDCQILGWSLALNGNQVV